MKRFPSVIVLAFAAFQTSAAPLPASAKAEGTALLGQLESSGCQFNRNGSWHSPSEARAHLQTKLEYLEKKGSAKSAEDFIDQVATKSSMSGTEYQVKCNGGEVSTSARWLKSQLQALRARQSKGN